ncbi:biotin-dependent carboxyltransferase family protein [Komagataeibacter xylinus]|uniref:Biotin-dependent carboxyltransferase family protein n=1 Tax=Komagataeibacter xylinus TaxID=28448 RepID=A0A857FQ51_KOMXY|nr:biotin-dependent carboxyltransferase family protein [Komagataeibacter xylinus]QHC36325.1 biotin-dependent carboxyltransferase family protein [Komagataeibacter xylinus]
MLEVLTNAPLNTVQDMGRPTAVPYGVSCGGAMDRDALMLGNILVGNDPGAAGIEIAFFPFRVRFRKNCVFAVTGAPAQVTLDGAHLPPCWSMMAQAGQTLIIEVPKKGMRSYLTLAGGVDVPIVLGGRSTDIKAGFGGFKGRGLQKGDVLPCAKVRLPPIPPNGLGLSFRPPMPGKEVPELHLLPAAEYDAFTEQAHACLVNQPWRITTHANRVGFRLEGETPLTTRQPLSLLSHGVMPGTVQVPPAGQPIIQMADANTCGGYPKIGVIIEPDLSFLSQMAPGAHVKFRVIDHAQALARIRTHRQHMRTLAQQVATAKTCIITQ